MILFYAPDFCKMDIRPTLGMKNPLLDFSFPSRKYVTGAESSQFFKEIMKVISLKNIGLMSILQKLKLCPKGGS
jgi:hypothetical protein